MKHLLLTLSAITLLTVNALAGSVPDISLDALKAAIAKKDVTILDVKLRGGDERFNRCNST